MPLRRIKLENLGYVTRDSKYAIFRLIIQGKKRLADEEIFVTGLAVLFRTAIAIAVM